jgi:hypothetical protein
MDVKTLIPKDKFDIETAEKLKNYSFEEVKTIVPNLLEWLQDGNWPVSKTVADFLTPFTENIAQEILHILKGNDEVWKYWILLIFGKNITNETVKDEIRRISLNPTEKEISEGVNEVAAEITQL